MTMVEGGNWLVHDLSEARGGFLPGRRIWRGLRRSWAEHSPRSPESKPDSSGSGEARNRAEDVQGGRVP